MNNELNFKPRRFSQTGFDVYSANPIQHYRRPRDERAAGWVLAIVIGVVGACFLAHFAAI